MLTDIQKIFGGMVSSRWAETMMDWGERVKIYRDYVEGKHRVYLTDKQRRMLNVTGKKFETFSADYTDLVVTMMAERLVVDRVEGIAPVSDMQNGRTTNADAQLHVPTDDEVDPLQAWIDELLVDNRFDGLQMDVHQTSVRDGDSFVIVDFDVENDRARFNFNQGWDGDVGVLPIYMRSDTTKLLAAVKIFYVDKDKKQATVYYKDKIVKYETDEKGIGFHQIGAEEQWLGGCVPVVQFSNRRRSGSSLGVSALQKVISLQDILNRSLTDMSMTSVMSAFQILLAKGFTPGSDITPGAIITALNENPQILSAIDLKAIQQAALTEYIGQINKIIDMIAEVTQTPIASTMGGGNQSGEALKQRESGLLTKVQGAQVKLGNAWEDLLMVAHQVEMAYAVHKPPPMKRFDCKWKDASVRNNTEVTAIADSVFRNLQNKPLYLEMMSEVTGWDEAKREQIMADDANLMAETLGGFGNLLGTAGEFGLRLNGVA